MPSPIVQFKNGQLFLSPGVNSFTLNAPVSAGSVLVAFSVLSSYNTPFTPTDSQSNAWQGPFPTDPFPYSYPTWYAVNVKAGTTTVTFPGFDAYNATSGAWTIVLEVLGGEFDNFSARSSDPPDEEIVTSTTTQAGDLIISIFGGPESSPPAIGLTAGAESTLIDSESIGYSTFNWSTLVQYQVAGPAGSYDNTATFDTDLCLFVMGMAIAFKSAKAAPAYAVTELPVQDSLALDSNVPTWENTLGQPYTSDESLPPIPAINLSYQPQDDGQVDLIYTPVPNTLSNTGVPLSFPPDFSIPVLYRALQILYSIQGEGADDRRAQYCGERYEMLVAMSKSMAFMGRQKSGRSIRVKR